MKACKVAQGTLDRNATSYIVTTHVVVPADDDGGAVAVPGLTLLVHRGAGTGVAREAAGKGEVVDGGPGAGRVMGGGVGATGALDSAVCLIKSTKVGDTPVPNSTLLSASTDVSSMAWPTGSAFLDEFFGMTG